MGLLDFLFGSWNKKRRNANGKKSLCKHSGKSSQLSPSSIRSVKPLKFDEIIKEEGLACCYSSTINKVCDNARKLFNEYPDYVNEDEKNEILDGIKYFISLMPANFSTNRIRASFFNRHTIELKDSILNISYNLHFCSDGLSWVIHENKESDDPFKTPKLLKSSPGFLVYSEQYSKTNIYNFFNDIFLLIGYPTLTNNNSIEEIKPPYSETHQNSGEDECIIGIQYLTGNVKEIDEKKALMHFKYSAESGYGKGMYYYSYCLIEGKGIKKNINEGAIWLKKACKLNVPLAYEFLGNLIDQDIFQTDNDPYLKNPYSKAFNLFKENAKKGNSEDIYHLALCYLYGNGVDEDEKKAISLLKEAIDKGSAEACFELAMLYLIGSGVPQNDNNYFEYMLKSAEMGYVEAIYQVGFCYEDGRGVSKDLKNAFEWYMKGAQKKHGFCQYKVGMFFLKGKGTKKDIDSAVIFLNLAGEKGFKDAKAIVDQIIFSDLSKD